MNEMPLVHVSGVYAGHLEHNALVQSVVHKTPMVQTVAECSYSLAHSTARFLF